MKRVALGLVAAGSLMACSAAEDSAPGAEQAALSEKPSCTPVLACAAPAMAPAAKRTWRHGIKSRIDVIDGSPHHRGRDLFLNPGEPQTVIAKLTYGITDEDRNLEDEEVDVFVQRECGTTWEKLGTALTTRNNTKHATVEGVDDDGGRVYFAIPRDKELGPGRHRVRLVVAGDGSSTDLFLEVVPAHTPIFVSDVDGTLTSSESIEFLKLLEGTLPETHAGAPEALSALAAKGYRPIYITARPEWLVQRTRDFLEARGFPLGVVHTSTSILGAGLGSAAAKYKTDELTMLARKGLVPTFGLGNKSSDSDAYAAAGIEPENHRIFFQIKGTFAGRRIDSYNDLLPGIAALPAACR